MTNSEEYEQEREQTQEEQARVVQQSVRKGPPVEIRAFLRAQTNDGCVLAQRIRGGHVRYSSVARRIRRMGLGAKGCAQCRLFHAHT